jgi:hypothetical protein
MRRRIHAYEEEDTRIECAFKALLLFWNCVCVCMRRRIHAYEEEDTRIECAFKALCCFGTESTRFRV